MSIDRLLSEISSGYYIRQVLVITLLTGYGFLLLQIFRQEISVLWQGLLSFPAGLAFYAVTGYVLLGTGIRFCTVSVTAAMLLALTGMFLITKKRGQVILPIDRRGLCLILLASLLAACLCCSGLLSVILENDSYYYYSEYPQVLVKEGHWKFQMDVYLTDVGPVAAIINALPFLFGFANSFGIQHALNISFLGIFYLSLYEKLREKKDKRSSVLLSLLAAVFLATSPAFLTTAKWIMAGEYFMIFFFLIMVLGDRVLRSPGKPETALLLALTVFNISLCMIRQEGILFSLFLIICLSAKELSNRQLVLFFWMPAAATAGIYYAWLYLILHVRPDYSFLTAGKALLAMGASAAVGFYLVCIRGRVLLRIQEKLLYLIPGMLAAANMLLLLLDHKRYLTNLYMMLMNIRLRNGWGYFGWFFALGCLAVFYRMLRKKEWKITFTDTVMLGELLMMLCAIWARGPVLQLGIGDSGNRVLLTAVPVMVYAVILRLSGSGQSSS